MNGEKHTPGEWFWSGNTLMANRDDHSEFVCDVDGASVADKALIAAAPEMFAALTEMLERDRRRYDSSEEAQAFFRRNNEAAISALLKSGSRP